MLRGKVLLGPDDIVQRHQPGNAARIPIQNQNNAVNGINQQSLDLRDGIRSKAGWVRMDRHGSGSIQGLRQNAPDAPPEVKAAGPKLA